jgi:sn-glycerol 3-phosphate transport system ATP-binding protein
MATVSIQSVSKSFGQQRILQDVDLKIEKGEFIVIVGPSGCGKSTLLRLIAGLDVVDTGSILINDQCVNRTPASKRDIAMVFQNYALYPHMTVYDNMAYGLKMRKVNKQTIRERVERVAEMLQLGDCMQRKPSELSGGQRQRVAMGRAIVRKPAVFLFDEPLSNLDFKLRTEMRHEIKKLHQQLNATCIYVTHDQTEAMTMADRLVVFHQGKVEQVGRPREVYEHPNSRFVASFLGHFPMNFIPALLDFENSQLIVCDEIKFPFSHMESQDVSDSIVVGIRPEHISFVKTFEPESIEAVVEFIDDMGSDKLVRVRTRKSSISLCVRVAGDAPFLSGACFIKIDKEKAMLFCSKSQQRLGGWSA